MLLAAAVPAESALAAKAVIAGKQAELGADGAAQVTLRCKGSGKCRGNLRIRSRKHRKQTYGRARFKVDEVKAAVAVRLKGKVAKKVHRKGRLRAVGIATTKAKGGKGKMRRSRRQLAIVPAARGPSVPVLNRIKANNERLYDTVTGQTFVSRGANYVRLTETASGAVYHSVFEPGLFNPAAAAATLDQMRHDGYNVVRVFIDPGGTAGEVHGIGRGIGTHEPIYGPYMDNFAQLARLAAERGMYVLPSLDQFPVSSYYWDIVAATNGPGGTPNMEGRNLSYLDKGRIAAKAEYMRQFSAALVSRIGPAATSVILAYQSDNEAYFEANRAPYDDMAGTVTPVTGVTYNMADPAQRQASADASLIEYTHRVRKGMLVSDPEAMMTIGFFTNRAVGKNGYDGFMTHCSTSCAPGVDYRYPGRPAAVASHGAADFIDLHAYPDADPWDAAAYLATVEEPQLARPYIIGELGALKSRYADNITEAAYSMRDAQIATCHLGAQGWIYWTWDTHEHLASQELFFHLTDSNGAINGQLAPIVRPDPCS